MPRTKSADDMSQRPQFAGLRVTCAFAGTETRTLSVRYIWRRGGFIAAMRLPELGAIVNLTFSGDAFAELPAAEARVIGVRLDPADAAGCGFEIAFTQLPEEVLRRLPEAPADTRPLMPSAPAPEGAERRAVPRVQTSGLGARVWHGDAGFNVRVNNLSMSGALFGYRPDACPHDLNIGDQLKVDVVRPVDSRRVSVEGTIVRFAEADGPCFAIRFNALPLWSQNIIEALILDSLRPS